MVSWRSRQGRARRSFGGFVKSALAAHPSRSFAFGPFVLVPERQLLLRGEKPVRIGGRALDLLTALVERPGDLVSKSELLSLVWPDTTVDEANLKVNMAAVRRALEEGPGSSRYIATVVGRGYRFVAPVEVRGAVDVPAEVAVPSGPGHNLPLASSRLFGRDDTVAAIRRDLDQSRLVSIVGAGGIGKTSVALAVAEAAMEAYGEGAWVVDLTTLKDPDRTAHAIAAVFGLEGHSADMLGVVCEFLRNRQTLLVLDNCEHVIEAAASCVDRILASAAGVRILATSREPLRLAKERVRRLSGLDAPAASSSVDARAALEFAAVQLFLERAVDAHAAFELTDVDAPLVAEICRRLDGLPLAIELAATRVGAFGVAGLLRQLDDRLRLLSGRRGGPERHRTLSATLDWSYGLLDESEAALLRAVSVFVGAFDVDGAAAVSGLAKVDAIDALSGLAAKSLVVVEPARDGMICRLLETTRAYAMARLRCCGDEEVVRSRHAEHVLAVLERAKSEWASRPVSEWGARYSPVVDDLRCALAWAGNGEAHRCLLLRLTAAGTVLWNHLSLTRECCGHVTRALSELAHTEHVGSAIEMQLRFSLAGATMFTRGLIPEVLTELQRSLDLAERLGDIEHRLRSLRTLGSFQAFACKLESAIGSLETFVAVAAQHDPSAVPDGETHLGISELHFGRLVAARKRLERLHERGELTLDDSRLARFLYDRKVDVGNVLSYAQWLTGSPDTAAKTAEETVARALETKHALSLSNALAVAACPVFFMSRRYEECARYAEMLEKQVREHGIVIWSPTARFFRGALACADACVPDRGLADLEHAVAEYRAIGHWVRMSFVLGILADAQARSGRLDTAEATIDDALAWGRANGERWCMPEVMRIRATILAAKGEVDTAEAALVEAIDVAREIGGLSWQLRASSDLAQRLRDRARHADAHDLLLPVYSSFTEGFDTHDLVTAANLLGAPARTS